VEAEKGGMMNAAYTTGGTGGGGNPMLGGGIPKFGNKDFPNLGSGGGGHRNLAKALGMDKGGSGADSSLTGSAYLRSERARYGKEFDANPALKERLAALVDLENPKAGVAVVESVMNRMNIPGVHGSMAKGLALGPKSFYGPGRNPGMVEARLAQLKRTGRLAERMKQIDAALGGSDQIQGYTDQGSRNDPNYNAGGIGININRERFNDWGVPGSRAYRLDHEAHVRGESRDLLSSASKAGMGGGSQTVSGGADLRVAFDNAPSGMKAHLKNWGVFGDPAKVDWGHAMSPSDPGGR
jgi:hypothetical protein